MWFARFWCRDNCGRWLYGWDCLVGDAGSVEFLKPCVTFGAAVLQNISGKIVSGLGTLPHLFSLIMETHLVDKKSMTKRPSALRKRENFCYLFENNLVLRASQQSLVE